MSNLFEFATRNKLRFPYKGNISVEDLWDLSVKELDSVFKTLNSQVKHANEESLLSTKTKDDEILDIKIAIVKHIFSVKKEETAAKLLEKENKEKRQRLLQIKAQKEDEALMNMSLEELDAELAKL